MYYKIKGKSCKITGAVLAVILCLSALLSVCVTAPALADSSLDGQWFYAEEFINADGIASVIEEYGLASAGKKVTVAVIDTGIIASHPIFDGITVLEGYNFIDGGTDVTDDTSAADGSLKYHGTHVAGIVAQMIAKFSLQNNIAVLPVKAGDEKAAFSLPKVAEAIKWAADNGADVINMSLTSTGTVSSSVKNQLEEAVAYAMERGAVCVAAAGNNGRNTDYNSYYPAMTEGVIGVMNYDESGQKYSTSNYGDGFELIAPGTNILSAYGQDEYQVKTGTSMASPVVAFMAALMQLKFYGYGSAAYRIYDAMCGYNADKTEYTYMGTTYSLRKADLVKMINYSGVSDLKITETSSFFDGDAHSVLYGSVPKASFKAKFYTVEDGQQVETPTDSPIVWEVRNIVTDKAVQTSDGSEFSLSEDLPIGNYIIHAKAKIISSTDGETSELIEVESNKYYLNVQLGTLKPVFVINDASSLNLELGSDTTVEMRARYSYTEGEQVFEGYYEGDVIWSVEFNGTIKNYRTEDGRLVISAPDKKGTVKISASLPQGAGEYRTETATLTVVYRPLPQSPVAADEGSKLAFKGTEYLFEIDGYKNTEYDAGGAFTWYVNGKLLVYTTGCTMNYKVEKGGVYRIEAYLDGQKVYNAVLLVPEVSKGWFIALLTLSSLALCGAAAVIVILKKGASRKTAAEDIIQNNGEDDNE
ncbi:MAG TPA: S8 family serine peptidase [Candidatus Faecicola pullistercoris]|nr:S8 family serine peptidase [Candidatus Faecicola pullistercoris]